MRWALENASGTRFYPVNVEGLASRLDGVSSAEIEAGVGFASPEEAMLYVLDLLPSETGIWHWVPIPPDNPAYDKTVVPGGMGTSGPPHPAEQSDARNPPRVIDRAEAHAIAEREVQARSLGTGVSGVYALDEITWRRPCLYAGPDLASCWIAYVERPVRGIRSSAIVLISRETGEVLFCGDAMDEG